MDRHFKAPRCLRLAVQPHPAHRRSLDRARQQTTGASVLLSEADIRVIPQHGRYVWPAELDLMARLAGLRLAERWGGWLGEPLGDGSNWHVSMYEHAR